jgi:hypothetical protein
MAAKFNRGTVLEIRVEADGVDLRVTAGCGQPNCQGCTGAPQAWLKIAPNNHPIQVGMRAVWRGETATFIHPLKPAPGLMGMMGYGVPTAAGQYAVKRIGKYRLIRADGTCKPAPACPVPPETPSADDLAAQWGLEAYMGEQAGDNRKG